MNYTTQHETRQNEAKSNGIAPQSTELLDLFAEELPTQQDLKQSQCLGCIGTASSTAGSCFSTLSSVSSL